MRDVRNYIEGKGRLMMPISDIETLIQEELLAIEQRVMRLEDEVLKDRVSDVRMTLDELLIALHDEIGGMYV